MRVFSCQSCGQTTSFENVRCERCGARLGYLPERTELHAFKGSDEDEEGTWVPIASEVSGR